ncbi:hypothetical protein APA_2558 [Pseudanabaena sp. lw0831]|uniref:transposase family protein n=1 Tax=Pseudanabaena sp. lw0831 TaxID=1357935 RepID=UPI0019158DB2|nr:transposase family protein [Pseudanabaena sp. lw0831]GBO54611.1 hypothetical protein APA_2558 [Pseudanabaena sp. lw0831]
MSKSLVDYLKAVPDPREAQGSRDDLWQILLIIIMGIMSGKHTYRGLERFVERHRRKSDKETSTQTMNFVYLSCIDIAKSNDFSGF